MELVSFIITIVLAIFVVLLFVAILAFVREIYSIALDTKTLIADLSDSVKGMRGELDEVKASPKVTDPFKRPKELFQSSHNIIVPKTPDEIRNQNFKKIQEGAEYGVPD